MALMLAVGLALLGAAPAAAHSELISSNPEAGQALDYAPIGVELVFNQDINESFATVSVVGPGNEQWAQGDTDVDGPTVTVSVREGAPVGRYTVGYRVTSADGHPITGSYDFTVTSLDPVDAPSSPSPTDAPAAAGAAATPTTTAAPAYDPRDPAASEGEREPKQDTAVLLTTLGIAVLGLGAIAVTLVIRKKNKP
ncbi:copper resistance protein CopC [Rhodococcus sp. BP-241]|nr:copper resistance protein CopC [Rhodococcus sp. BP-241]